MKQDMTMSFQPNPHEPNGPRTGSEEARTRQHALRLGAELERRGMGWVIGPAEGRLKGDPYALYHVRDTDGGIITFATLDEIDVWLARR